MTSESGPIRYTTDGPIAVATIDRPERKNAINFAAYRGLIDAIAKADGDPAIRVLILTGAGNSFTSGNDLQDFAANPDGAKIAIDFLHAIANAEKPVIAAVEGHAVGIGTTMLLHCDFAYAGSGARFRMPFVNLGLTPEGGSSLLVPTIAGAKRATQLLLLGEEFNAKVAAESGFITAEVDDGTAMHAAIETARKIAALPAEGMKQSKALLRRPMREAVAETIDHEAKVFYQRLQSPEAQAAFMAFLMAKKA